MKTPMPPGWQYQRIEQSRLDLLMRDTRLDQLVADVFAGAEVVETKLREPCNEARREGVMAYRVRFGLHLVSDASREAADRLLNGAYGLRACYCHSPQAGRIANGAVCRVIADAIRERPQFIALSETLGDTLAKESAKVWFDAETDKRPAVLSDGEVLSDLWVRSRENPQAVEAGLQKLSPQQIETSLAKGRSVPRPLGLDVKGAFIDSNGAEYVPSSKKSRSLQIHLMGWT